MDADRTSDERDRPSPEGPPGGSVVFLLSTLGVAASRGFHDALAGVDLEPRQFGVLNVVAQSEGTSQQALAKPLGIPASRMVAIVDELEERALVERRRNAEDRRAYALHLTAKGRRVLKTARRLARDYDDRFGASLAPAERDHLLALLRRLATDQSIALGVHPGLLVSD